MGLKFTKYPADTFSTIQLNAGIICEGFDPDTLVVTNILGATTGGVTFASNPTYVDFGEDVDNVPANTQELKKLQAFDPVFSGTMITVSPTSVKRALAAADIDTGGIKIVPRAMLKTADFHDIWWIGDYSDVNEGADAGFLAIHLMRALNQTGFQFQSTKNGKGTSAFEFHGHYTLTDEESTPPFEIYVKAGESE